MNLPITAPEDEDLEGFCEANADTEEAFTLDGAPISEFSAAF